MTSGDIVESLASSSHLYNLAAAPEDAEEFFEGLYAFCREAKPSDFPDLYGSLQRIDTNLAEEDCFSRRLGVVRKNGLTPLVNGAGERYEKPHQAGGKDKRIQPCNDNRKRKIVSADAWVGGSSGKRKSKKGKTAAAELLSRLEAAYMNALGQAAPPLVLSTTRAQEQNSEPSPTFTPSSSDSGCTSSNTAATPYGCGSSSSMISDHVAASPDALETYAGHEVSSAEEDDGHSEHASCWVDELFHYMSEEDVSVDERTPKASSLRKSSASSHVKSTSSGRDGASFQSRHVRPGSWCRQSLEELPRVSVAGSSAGLPQLLPIDAGYVVSICSPSIGRSEAEESDLGDDVSLSASSRSTTYNNRNSSVVFQATTNIQNGNHPRASRPKLLTLTSFPYRVVEANPAFLSLTGHSMDSICGKTIFDIFVMRDEKEEISKRPCIASCPNLQEKFDDKIVQIYLSSDDDNRKFPDYNVKVRSSDALWLSCEDTSCQAHYFEVSLDQVSTPDNKGIIRDCFSSSTARW